MSKQTENLESDATNFCKSKRKLVHRLQILLLILLPAAVLTLIILMRPPSYLSISNIPEPDWEITYDPNETINNKLLEAEEHNTEIRQLKEDYRKALLELAEMQKQVYAKIPFLYSVEEYRNIPRRWMESERGEILVQLKDKHKSRDELRPFVTWQARKELKENDKYKRLELLSFETLPSKMWDNIISESDKRTGFTPETPPPPCPEETSERILWWAQLADERIPYINDQLNRKMEEYHVDKKFISALKLKTAVSMLTGGADVVIQFHTPQNLVQKRSTVRKLEKKLSNTIFKMNQY